MPLAAATPPAATAGAGSAAVRLPGPWSLGATAGWLLMAFAAYASISIAAGAALPCAGKLQRHPIVYVRNRRRLSHDRRYRR